MIIGTGEMNNLKFINPAGEELLVRELPKDFSKLRYDTMYPIGEYLYRYYGTLNWRTKQSGKTPGSIFKFGDTYIVVNFDGATDIEKSFFNVRNVSIEDEDEESLENIFIAYANNYVMKNNLVIDNKKKLVDTGNAYIPELKENDDAMTRIMKLMIIHMGVVLTNHKGKFDKEYSLDNMRSAINGATVNMTITKFLAWCHLLDLDWEFRLEDNGTDELNPLSEPIVISNYNTPWIECGESEEGVFKVPLTEGEDPLKRIIKVCVIKKHMSLADYKHKGSTPHLINNMRSALRRDSRMMFPYFVYWCEVLGVDYILTLKNPKDDYVVRADVNYKSSEYMNHEVYNNSDGED